MKYYVLKPEVAGSYGPNTAFVDFKARPPLLEKFNYEFDGWLGDPILEVICNYIVTDELKGEILKMEATGVQFSDVEVSRSHEYDEWQRHMPGTVLPRFVWLKVTGQMGKDDFGYTASNGAYLVVSERVLDLLLRVGTRHCDFAEIEAWKGDKLNSFRRQE
jgi:hypothetical protein